MAIHVNWGLGFFRAWVIFSILTTIVVFGGSYDHVAKEFELARHEKAYLEFVSVLLPADCSQALGKEGEDYRRNSETNICWYPEAKFRSFYPEYKDVEILELTRRLYTKYSQPIHEGHPWKEMGELAAISAGISGVVFLIGASIYWVFAGFAKPRPPKQGFPL